MIAKWQVAFCQQIDHPAALPTRHIAEIYINAAPRRREQSGSDARAAALKPLSVQRQSCKRLLYVILKCHY